VPRARVSIPVDLGLSDYSERMAVQAQCREPGYRQQKLITPPLLAARRR
jgi:hypothetical protein